MLRNGRSLAFLGAFLACAAGVALLNCAEPAEEGISGADAVVGANNALGLSLVYDATDRKVRATVREELEANDALYLRVRRGTITQDAEAKLDCEELASVGKARKLSSRPGEPAVYDGPVPSKEILKLITLYNDPRWYGGRETAKMRAEAEKGPDPIVEACIVRDGQVRAKMLTNLAYAWDRGNELAKTGRTGTSSVHFNAGDGGTAQSDRPITDEEKTQIVEFVNDPETTIEVLDDKVGLDRRAAKNIINRRNGPDGVYPSADDNRFDDFAELDAVTYVAATALKKIRDYAVANADPAIREGERHSTIDYANLCVQELGEIPFFKKLGKGKYDSFDCRDFVGTNADGAPTGAIAGVEGAVIPLTVDDRPQTECSPGRGSERTYDCVDKCDKAMWLTASSHTGLGRRGACQPGVTVTTAKNDKGTHWVLLCRKVENRDNAGMMKTKTFNDIAIIGNNPTTGNTCFFQNKENIGNDGSRVTHPADIARSSAIWPAEPSSYCTKNCHATDAFVHSPWIDGAKKRDGKTVVPKFGENPDYLISDLAAPYRLVNGPAQGFGTSPQFTGEAVGACVTCHRVAGAAFAEFSEWATGTGDAYYGKITDSYKRFEKSHWMPPRLEGLNEENFASSSWGKAVQHIRACTDNPNAPGCEFATVPER